MVAGNNKTPRSWSKALTARPRLVAVITDAAELARAGRLRRLPDFFEVRLDALHPLNSATLAAIERLPAPRILTARHPEEGGLHQMSPAQRRALLEAYLPRAGLIDVELRAAEKLADILETARRAGVGRILSVHDFHRAPTLERLEGWLRAAALFRPEVFKVAVRTDDAEEFACLLEFFQKHRRRTALAAMGVGAWGRRARLELARRGSVLNYAHLGQARVPGQLALAELRRTGHFGPSPKGSAAYIY